MFYLYQRGPWHLGGSLCKATAKYTTVGTRTCCVVYATLPQVYRDVTGELAVHMILHDKSVLACSR